MATALIVLAAGQGTRMNSDLPKVLHELGGVPLFAHALASGRTLEPERTVLVVGHGAEAVAKAAHEIDPHIAIADQTEQLGTGHAVAQAKLALKDFEGDVFVLYGDTPFIRAETLDAMEIAREEGNAVVVLGFEAEDPGRYGRLVMKGHELTRIVEFKDATEDELDITLCNSGVICADATVLFDLLDAVSNDNASGEYYLTDIVEIARSRGLSATVVTCPEDETLGINSRPELADAESLFQDMCRGEALENGVTMVAPETVFFSADTVIGRDVVIEPNVVFGPGVTVETGARIRAFSHLEGAHVGGDAVVGPYARLRPGAELDAGAKVGNFVEIKNAQVGIGAKVNHLTYIGDATIGEGANIGAGTVTCNYNGFEKFHTEIGARAFIGSDTMLVAPVTVGAGAITGSGSVITQDVPADALALGRSQQVVKEGAAPRLFELYKRNKKNRQQET
ncbi:bifunctional UDP-N-acetylglucosamine diphosphorylase/glucosamine-1-phosphate N-acetyltransferase GlmU [Psychromarinibacter halotolerans]|uniref:Bifunctional protein GlmU n=1 Tax=Psychromarinibacter halotolerans TaxID=1775175 RepID=A0ABV7GUA6_9RHOB|nr:bifunctional UDP-N-acetylglucosamine diphosphorylase/glucosamine-1-phosphate N-acetyltransferase GlmU [Psychromarinibacter halotolerans]MDF0598153.1 bifunctional UDP-N-acetylglucosamine diphosphorylase/glucosamine-1-phosphate N-acetyltransferase GlmU [Psychromarinibacter halotolerans]